MVRGGVRLIVIDTLEEARAVDISLSVAYALDRPLFTWKITQGLHRQDGHYSPQLHARRPQAAVSQIRGTSVPGIYLLLDFAPYFDDVVNRMIRDIAGEELGQTVIFIGSGLTLPETLQPLAGHHSLSDPTDAVLKEIVREEVRRYRQLHHGQRVHGTKEDLAKVVQNLRGLKREDARRMAHRAIFDDGVIDASDLATVAEAKFKLLDPQGTLDFTFETASFSEVGGLGGLKRWLEIRRQAFLGDHDGDRPKGMLLVGVQGCGKSLAAKSVAGTWAVPLLALDIGRLYNKYHGETERNLRKALEVATKMAPCVLWIDEIEKGLSVSDSDSGTSQRVLGTLLTWMNEDKPAVFLVATANAIERLPPELVRKGRVDELFFVDLPSPEVRGVILEIHLRRRGQQLSPVELERLVVASEGFSGSELEAAVISGLYHAQAKGGALTCEHVLGEIAGTQPLSVVMAERLDALREWAAGRTVPVD